MAELVLVAESERIVTLTLNRPEKLNAFGDDMREQLVAALAALEHRSGIGVLVITGAGRAFSAGGDVHHMAALERRGAGFDEVKPLLDLGARAIRLLAALPFPTLAAVNGVAAGAGLNLALACDLIVASDQARLGETFARVGLHPDWGGTYHLTRRVGVARALELCWLGETIDAGEALRIGLVDRVAPHQRLGEEVRTLARRLAAAPATSVRLAKRSLRAAPFRTLDQCLEAEAEAQAICWDAAEIGEGLRAFVEKREPAFPPPGESEPAGIGAESAPRAAARHFE